MKIHLTLCNSFYLYLQRSNKDNKYAKNEQTQMCLPLGGSEESGPRVAGGVLESCQRHGGLLYPITAQGYGVLHPVCQNTVGGRM